MKTKSIFIKDKLNPLRPDCPAYTSSSSRKISIFEYSLRRSLNHNQYEVYVK